LREAQAQFESIEPNSRHFAVNAKSRQILPRQNLPAKSAKKIRPRVPATLIAGVLLKPVFSEKRFCAVLGGTFL
jgi:hypothetical protein